MASPLHAFVARIRRNLMTVDPRSLAAYRIATGVLLVLSVLLRWKNVDLFYTNTGIHTNVHIAFLPTRFARPSLLLGFGTGEQVRAFFLFSIAVYTCFLVGYRTKFFHVLAFLCALSIHARSPFMSYGGDDVMRSFLLWTLFLPLGRVWSVDAYLAARRGRPLPTRPVESFAVFGLALQLAVIYGFTFYDKLTPVWLRGEAIHYTMWMDELVTPLAAWLRTRVPFGAFWALNWYTLAVEAAAVPLLLSPWRTGTCRLVALVPLGLLHFGIFFLIDVDLFSPTMVSTYLLFVTPDGWDRLAAVADRMRRGFGSLLRIPDVAPPPPAAPRLVRAGRITREALAVWLGVSVVTNAFHSSLRFPEAWKPSDRSPTLSWAYATNIWQRWGMFSEPRPEVGWFVMAGRTRDGREIDPITGGPVVREIRTGYAPSLGLFLYYFSQTMRSQAMGIYGPELADFVWRSHRLPGRTPDDEIVSFSAYSLERTSPPPGETTPGPHRATLLLYARRPGEPAAEADGTSVAYAVIEP
ncbi:MAG: hypothetical protein D6705_14100 [Deltaproteobacteria bacterium]|nr:MAG: hypothetical protein D6705_14100 [Deltaproteobacteria bacterium]